MTGKRRIDGATLVGSLTVDELRAVIAEEIEDKSPAYGATADSDTGTILTELRELHDALDDLDDRIMDQIDFFIEVYKWWQGDESGDAEVLQLARHQRRDERITRFARKLLELGSTGDADPTQEALAAALGVSDRYLRRVGWEAIRVRAAELEADRNNRN